MRTFFLWPELPENLVREVSVVHNKAKLNRAKQIALKNQSPTLAAENESKIEKLKAQIPQE